MLPVLKAVHEISEDLRRAGPIEEGAQVLSVRIECLAAVAGRERNGGSNLSQRRDASHMCRYLESIGSRRV